MGYDRTDLVNSFALCAWWLVLWGVSTVVENAASTSRAKRAFSSPEAGLLVSSASAAALLGVMPSGAQTFGGGGRTTLVLGEFFALLRTGDSTGRAAVETAKASVDGQWTPSLIRWSPAYTLTLLGAGGILAAALHYATFSLQRDASSKLSVATVNLGLIAALLMNLIMWE